MALMQWREKSIGDLDQQTDELLATSMVRKARLQIILSPSRDHER